MAKICLIGAGSTVFAQSIIGDILSQPDLADSVVALHDIDGERLKTSATVARRIGAASASSPARSACHSAISASQRRGYSSSGTWYWASRSSRPALMNHGLYSAKWTLDSVTKCPVRRSMSKRTASSAGTWPLSARALSRGYRSSRPPSARRFSNFRK